MTKCLKILIKIKDKENFLKNIIQKYSKKYDLEGFAQIINDDIKIIACGQKDNVDNFVDTIHKESIKLNINNVEIEPFIKDKDYRGIFRIIE